MSSRGEGTSAKSRIFDLLLGRGVDILKQVICQKQHGGSRLRGKGLGGIHTRKNGHCVYIARPDSAQRGGAAAQQQQQQQQGGAASGNKCSKVELVSPAEQTSEIALSELKDKEDKERYFSQLLQLAVNGQRGRKRKRAAQQRTQKGGKKTAAHSSRSRSSRKRARTNKTRAEIPVFQ